MKTRHWTMTLGALLVLAAPVRAQKQFSNGTPNGQAGWDIFNDFRAADDFTFASTTTFNRIRFWGLLPTGLSYTPTIFWEILANAGAVPGSSSLASGSVFAQALRRSTLASGFDSWQFDLPIQTQSLGAGTYWLALHDGLIGNTTDSTLLWEATSASSGSQFAVQFLPTGEWTADWGSDLAFELRSAQVTPEPVTVALVGSGLLGLLIARRRRGKRETQTDCTEENR